MKTNMVNSSINKLSDGIAKAYDAYIQHGAVYCIRLTVQIVGYKPAADGCRSKSGQVDAAGGSGKKALKAAQRRTRVSFMQEHYRVSTRHACTVIRNGTQNLDSALSEIFPGFQATNS